MWAWKHPHSADGSVSYTPLTGDVRFEDVTFGYNPNKVILKDISLFAKPGQKLAFVGSTGAGKDNNYQPDQPFLRYSGGKIRYDGINITKIKKDDLRRSLGIVLQDTHLFTGTIREISVTEILMQLMSRSTKLPDLRTQTSSSGCCQTVI